MTVIDPDRPHDANRDMKIAISYNWRERAWIASSAVGQDKHELARGVELLGLLTSMTNDIRSAWKEIAAAKAARGRKVKDANERRAAARAALSVSSLEKGLTLASPIADLPMSPRAFNALANAGIVTLADYQDRYDDHLPNFGKVSRAEVDAFLAVAVDV